MDGFVEMVGAVGQDAGEEIVGGAGWGGGEVEGEVVVAEEGGVGI